MTSMGIQAALAVLLLLAATVKADEGEASFWGEYLTMTCPYYGTWYYKKNNVSEGYKYTLKYDNTKKGLYECRYENGIYYFYVQGKVCENCFELDGILFALAIIADMSVTGFVIMIIYMRIKKRGSPGHTSKAPAHSGGRAPPVPSPDYEQLNTHTRSKDTYSTVNRMG